jgi:hypothetical protein
MKRKQQHQQANPQSNQPKAKGTKPKVNWSAFFSELPQLVQSAEKIYGATQGSGQTKKQKILSIANISAQEAAKNVAPHLDPHNATIAQAASAEVDTIVTSYNQNGWPAAAVAGVAGATGIVAAVQEQPKAAAAGETS